MDNLLQTSPIPEDAPVMITTLLATFSLHIFLFKEKIYLRKRNGGNKKRMAVKVNGRSTMFNNFWSKSITFRERERERNWRYDDKSIDL